MGTGKSNNESVDISAKKHKINFPVCSSMQMQSNKTPTIVYVAYQFFSFKSKYHRNYMKMNIVKDSPDLNITHNFKRQNII